MLTGKKTKLAAVVLSSKSPINRSQLRNVSDKRLKQMLKNLKKKIHRNANYEWENESVQFDVRQAQGDRQSIKQKQKKSQAYFFENQSNFLKGNYDDFDQVQQISKDFSMSSDSSYDSPFRQIKIFSKKINISQYLEHLRAEDPQLD